MKAFGFLSFGHYGHGTGIGDPDAKTSLQDALDITIGADELGVNGAYWRVHHFARQAASPIAMLAAAGARTKNIEVGTGVIDMRYENPLMLAEDIATLDLLLDQRIAIGVSRGSPEPAKRGWEAFGYTGSTDPRGADIAYSHFDQFLSAIKGEGQADLDASGYILGTPPSGPRLRIEPHSPGVEKRIWWGAGSRQTAIWAAQQGVNLMSSTLLTETEDGKNFSQLQNEQIELYRRTWKEAGHDFTPRVSVSRSIFPIVDAADAKLFGRAGEAHDSIGIIDGLHSTFGKTYAAEPDVLIEQLLDDEAVMNADTLMLTIPSNYGVDLNLKILENFATHVAPALGWRPNTKGLPTGYPVD
ncbi:alkane 1-monooxygenase [Corynebacterium sp. 13CS0277]|uniref:LLM class flavin-dependent oxidoreductase n=1 Tax=Corynebacterium sp. 13CS0277 TaxID=2071994 RepID=UPI000D03A22C|nr:LLM class flavin-dependent oxidoreductase [Corynebacterium sp. 13CS0277]PRQ12435.1 alkane 1-monooxygenase [Corynebacterium sp. 13CS0277]